MTGHPAGSPVALGADLATDLDQTIRREWLVTNGQGSYAFSTVAGITTRSYHARLVAALDPPVGRARIRVGDPGNGAAYQLRVCPPQAWGGRRGAACLASPGAADPSGGR